MNDHHQVVLELSLRKVWLGPETVTESSDGRRGPEGFPEGHIYAKRYGSKIYECLLCKALKQTRRGRPEYMGPKRFFEVVGEHDPRWSLEASRCPNPRR